MNMELLTEYFVKNFGTNSLSLYVFVIIFVALLIDFFQKRILRKIQTRLTQTKTLWMMRLLRQSDDPCRF